MVKAISPPSYATFNIKLIELLASKGCNITKYAWDTVIAWSIVSSQFHTATSIVQAWLKYGNNNIIRKLICDPTKRVSLPVVSLPGAVIMCIDQYPDIVLDDPIDDTVREAMRQAAIAVASATNNGPPTTAVTVPSSSSSSSAEVTSDMIMNARIGARLKLAPGALGRLVIDDPYHRTYGHQSDESETAQNARRLLVQRLVDEGCYWPSIIIDDKIEGIENYNEGGKNANNSNGGLPLDMKLKSGTKSSLINAITIRSKWRHLVAHQLIHDHAWPTALMTIVMDMLFTPLEPSRGA
jgi:hypothetical protein